MAARSTAEGIRWDISGHRRSPAKIVRLPWILVLATTLAAGCSSSGYGPLNAPQVGQAPIFAAAVEWLSANTELGKAPIFVRDHTITGASERFDGSDAWWHTDGPGPFDGQLDDATQRAIADRLRPDHEVAFVSAVGDYSDGTDAWGCPIIREGGSLIHLASLESMAVHGDYTSVVIGLTSGCSTSEWLLRVAWQPGEPIGGAWSVAESVAGATVSP